MYIIKKTYTLYTHIISLMCISLICTSSMHAGIFANAWRFITKPFRTPTITIKDVQKLITQEREKYNQDLKKTIQTLTKSHQKEIEQLKKNYQTKKASKASANNFEKKLKNQPNGYLSKQIYDGITNTLSPIQKTIQNVFDYANKTLNNVTQSLGTQGNNTVKELGKTLTEITDEIDRIVNIDVPEAIGNGIFQGVRKSIKTIIASLASVISLKYLQSTLAPCLTKQHKLCVASGTALTGLLYLFYDSWSPIAKQCVHLTKKIPAKKLLTIKNILPNDYIDNYL